MRIFVFAVLAPLCLVILSPSAFAKEKNKRSGAQSETRSRRASDRQRRNNKNAVAENRGTAKRKTNADRNRSSARQATTQEKRRTRGRENVRETAKSRESANRRADAPAVKQTLLVIPKPVPNQPVTRPTLVNDIVIISEATPTARRISSEIGSSDHNMPSIWPVAGAIRGGFGVRRNPFGGSSSEFHKGQDISAKYGDQVIATADGVVVNAGWLRGYGQVVYVEHGNGISTRYGHLSRIDVTIGDVIKRGDHIGLVGSTGRSTGPHLHYEVRIDGQATNPIPYLPAIPVPPVTKSPTNR
jgi:murein DD-endopeptidase MepM/ murein hydrolase activator NlpD